MQADPSGEDPGFSILKQMTDGGSGGGVGVGVGVAVLGVATAVVALAQAVNTVYHAVDAFAKEAAIQKKRTIDEFIEKILEKQIALKTPQSATVIYRYGGTNPGNLTPRSIDINGLSFSLIPPKPGQYAAMTTIGALNATGLVVAIQDKPTHVCVIPIGTTPYGWSKAGASSIWTQAVKSVVVKVRG